MAICWAMFQSYGPASVAGYHRGGQSWQQSGYFGAPADNASCFEAAVPMGTYHISEVACCDLLEFVP